MTFERTYTVPLKHALLKVPRYKRANKAISALKEFARRHGKSTDVKIGKHLNLKTWEHGIKNIPASIKVTLSKDDKGTVRMELFGAPKEEKKAEAPKKGKATGIEAAIKGVREKTETAAEKKDEVPAEKKVAAKAEKATAADAAEESKNVPEKEPAEKKVAKTAGTDQKDA
jgi:large subunit ribosomal protein L31e